MPRWATRTSSESPPSQNRAVADGQALCRQGPSGVGGIPNYSSRMSAVSAATIRPQIPTLDERREKYSRGYAFVTEKLVEQRGNFLSIPINTPGMTPVHNSLQFNISHDLTNNQVIK